MSTIIRQTQLEVYIHGERDYTAFAAVCSFGFDQRYAEAAVRRTGGGTIAIAYWDQIEIRMGTTPGEGAAPRFRGYIIPVENQLYPIEGTLQCRGYLYRAAWVRNPAPGGHRMAEPDTGKSDEQQVLEMLETCAVPHDPAHIGGTGKSLGLHTIDAQQPLAPNPFVWAEGSSGLEYIEQLDEISVPDTANGAYRTFESLGGEVHRILVVTNPTAAADFSFTEGEDVLDARIGRDPTASANRVVVTGAPDPINKAVPPGAPDDINVAFTAVCTHTATATEAPYLPPGLPSAPDGFTGIALSFSSPMIEKSRRDDPDVGEDVQSCQNVAEYLLGEANTVVDILEFATPRDDLLGVGQTIHLHSPRLGLTDATRHYWLQHLDVELDERGAFTQRLRLLRKS